MKSSKSTSNTNVPDRKKEIWRFSDDLTTKRKWILCPKTLSRYIKTDHIVPVETDERVNYFDPDVDPLAGVDASVFDQLSQDAKQTHSNPPTQSPLYNPYLLANQNKNKPMSSIEIKKGQVATVNPIQDQNHKTTIIPPSGGNKLEAINVDEFANLTLKKTNENTAEGLPNSPQLSSPLASTTTSNETSTTAATAEALKTTIDDGTTESFGTDFSNGDTEDSSNTSKNQTASTTTNLSKRLAKTLQRIKAIDSTVGCLTTTTTAENIFATSTPSSTSARILFPDTYDRESGKRESNPSQVSFSERTTTATMESEHTKYCDMTIVTTESRSIGLKPKANQSPAPLGGESDRLNHIKDDLELQHEQLQAITISLARKELVIAKEIHDKTKVLDLLTSRQNDGRLYIPKSCKIGTEYQIRKELQHDKELIAVKNKISAIKQQAEELLADEMRKGAEIELGEIWGWKSDLTIRGLVFLANHISEKVFLNEKLTSSEWNDPPAKLQPMYCILGFSSVLEERNDFFGDFIRESAEEFNFFIAQIFGVKNLQDHMNTIGTKLLGSQRARHHINRTVHWLEISFIPATITLEEKVAEQVCEQVLERKMEATGQARTKVEASEATALALALHAEHNNKDLEDERIILKTADEVEQRMDNKTKRKLQKKLNSGTHHGNAHPAKRNKARTSNEKITINHTPQMEIPAPQWNWQPPPGLPPQMIQAHPPTSQQYWNQPPVTNMTYHYPPQAQTFSDRGNGQGRGRGRSRGRGYGRGRGRNNRGGRSSSRGQPTYAQAIHQQPTFQIGQEHYQEQTTPQYHQHGFSPPEEYYLHPKSSTGGWQRGGKRGNYKGKRN
jgi:hypothetical protein